MQELGMVKKATVSHRCSGAMGNIEVIRPSALCTAFAQSGLSITGCARMNSLMLM